MMHCWHLCGRSIALLWQLGLLLLFSTKIGIQSTKKAVLRRYPTDFALCMFVGNDVTCIYHKILFVYLFSFTGTLGRCVTECYAYGSVLSMGGIPTVCTIFYYLGLWMVFKAHFSRFSGKVIKPNSGFYACSSTASPLLIALEFWTLFPSTC